MSACDNPYATRRVERLLAFDPTLCGTTWEALESRWESLGRRACVTGPHGAGKTSFLDAFARRLEGRHRVVRLFFNDRHHRIGESEREALAEVEGAVLLLDGDRHLPMLHQWGIRRRAGGAAGLLSARHQAGGLPELLRLRPDPALAKTLRRRLDPASESSGDFAARFAAHHGNLRELWLECYDRWENQEVKF